MYSLQDIVRRSARMVGWEIGEAIEGVMWTIGIGCFVLCCAVFACGQSPFKYCFIISSESILKCRCKSTAFFI